MNTNNKKVFRVGIYLRLSDEDSDKINKLDDSESIKNQRYLLLEEIKKRDNFLLMDEYVDENLSGAGTYRPEFERLIKDCESGKLDIVLCKSQSRFSRDMEIIEKYLHNKFIEWNVRFISLSDYADTDNSGNKKARQINGLVNEWYLEDVSNNIRSAFRAKMLNGEFISPFTVFGYKIDSNNNNKLVIDSDASEVVRKIYFLYLKGMGYESIAKYLNVRNIPSPSYYKYLKGIKLNVVSNKPRDKIKWSSTAIKTILTNEIYLGHLVQGKRTTVSYKNHKIKNKNKNEWIKVLNTHEAIIEEDVFNRVQECINKRTRISKNTGNVHIFAGKVFCSLCGSIIRKKNSSRYDYLVCSNSQFNLCDNKTSIRYDKLDVIILKEINKILNKFYDVDILENNFNKNNYIDKRVRELENKRLDNEDKINKNSLYFKCLYEDKVNGVINEREFRELVNYYNDNQDISRNNIDKINKDIDMLKIRKQGFKNNILSKYRVINKLDRVLVDEFINSIYIGDIVDKKREIKIKWNF